MTPTIKFVLFLTLLTGSAITHAQEDLPHSSLHPTGYESVFKYEKEDLAKLHLEWLERYSIPKDLTLAESLDQIDANVAEEYGEESKEYIQALVLKNLRRDEIQSTKERKQLVKYNRQAINKARKFSESEPGYFVFVSMHTVAKYLLIPENNFLYIDDTQIEPLIKFLEQARQFYQANGPDNSEGLVAANYYLALAYMGRGGRYQYNKYLGRSKFRAQRFYQRSADMINDNLRIFENWSGPTDEAELLTRAAFIHVLETTGQHDEATEQCIKIGSLRPWDDSQNQTPLFRMWPIMPRQILYNSGSVTLEFTVSTAGTVKEVEVIKSKGGAAFERESIAAVKKWRYAPKFENGIPVEARTQVELFFSLYD